MGTGEVAKPKLEVLSELLKLLEVESSRVLASGVYHYHLGTRDVLMQARLATGDPVEHLMAQVEPP